MVLVVAQASDKFTLRSFCRPTGVTALEPLILGSVDRESTEDDKVVIVLWVFGVIKVVTNGSSVCMLFILIEERLSKLSMSSK